MAVKDIVDRIRIVDIAERVSVLEDIGTDNDLTSVMIDDIKYLLKVIERLNSK